VKEIKNIVIGCIVSFIGSIPFGYLNCIGFEIYSKKGLQNTMEYLLGVVSIEVFVIYGTLKFSKYLVEQNKWMKKIELFTIIFLLSLGILFYFNNNQQITKPFYSNYSSFLTGIVLSCFNFIQIPFWSGWNLYLLNNKYITIQKKEKLFYLLGTLIGTFAGMMCFILGLNYLHEKASKNYKDLVYLLLPLLFISLAVIQIIKFYKKYYLKKT
jgi:threonine/homoserine/homoserine lactone efflux protein